MEGHNRFQLYNAAYNI